MKEAADFLGGGGEAGAGEVVFPDSDDAVALGAEAP